MSQDAPSFFTLEHGTASTAAALVAPVEGRYRMLAAATAPAAVDPEALLEDLAWRVARTDALVAGSLDGWRDWSRLEVHTWRPPRACLVAASAETGTWLERAFTGAGWQVAARHFGPAQDLIAFGEACLDPRTDAVVMGGREDAEGEERDQARLLWPRAGSLARLRDDLAVIACGPFVERPEGIADTRLFSMPAPEPVAVTTESRLRQAARQVGAHLINGRPIGPFDARDALRASIASLAVLLGSRVEGVEIGAASGSRTFATAEGEQRHAVLAAAALLPRELLEDDEAAEVVLRWCSLAGDPASRLDRLRDLVLGPWTQLDHDGLLLRMAALRASLERLQSAWEGEANGRSEHVAADVLVLAGGIFDILPPAATALAIADGLRHPGAFTILHDHARILAPLGALPVENDRRRLLADLMDDILLPVGSALLTGAPVSEGAESGSLAVSSSLGDEEFPLDAGRLRMVDLPPGIVARLEVDPGQGSVLGVEGRRFQLEASGGLGGLLIDTRPIPLELPPAGEQRRARLEEWEAPAWLGTDR